MKSSIRKIFAIKFYEPVVKELDGKLWESSFDIIYE